LKTPTLSSASPIHRHYAPAKPPSFQSQPSKWLISSPMIPTTSTTTTTTNLHHYNKSTTRTGAGSTRSSYRGSQMTSGRVRFTTYSAAAPASTLASSSTPAAATRFSPLFPDKIEPHENPTTKEMFCCFAGL
jgi:hypothetical protein